MKDQPRPETSIPINILMVEDNPDDVELAREALLETKLRNRLYVARDGVEAMDFLHRRGNHVSAPVPDLVLLDLNLPRKDGREVLEEIKQDAGLKHIPVVILTTSEAEEDILSAYKRYANCYITKPVDFEQFAKVVRSIESFWFIVVKLPHP